MEIKTSHKTYRKVGDYWYTVDEDNVIHEIMDADIYGLLEFIENITT